MLQVGSFNSPRKGVHWNCLSSGRSRKLSGSIAGSLFCMFLYGCSSGRSRKVPGSLSGSLCQGCILTEFRKIPEGSRKHYRKLVLDSVQCICTFEAHKCTVGTCPSPARQVGNIFADLYKCKSRKVAGSLPEGARKLTSHLGLRAHITMPFHHHLVLQQVCQLVFKDVLQLFPQVLLTSCPLKSVLQKPHPGRSRKVPRSII